MKPPSISASTAELRLNNKNDQRHLKGTENMKKESDCHILISPYKAAVQAKGHNSSLLAVGT